MNVLRMFVAMSVFVLGAGTALAQPARIPVQGVLADSSGTPLDGTFAVTFSLYDVETGGTALYAEGQTVSADRGLFTAYVGETNPLDLMVFDAPDTWLGIRVGGDAEMTPRIRLATVPYAAVALLAKGVSPGSVTSAALAAGSVTNAALAAGSVGAAQLADGSVTMAKISNSAVGTPQIAFGAVGANQIAGGAVDGYRLADNSVTSAKVADGTIASADLATASVTGAKIAAGAVGTSNIADGSVTSVKIATEAVGFTQIATGAVTNLKIANGSVTSSKIGPSAVGATQIATGAVGTTQIADGAVTNAKLTLTTVEYSTLSGSSTTSVTTPVAFRFCALSNVSWYGSGSSTTGCDIAVNANGLWTLTRTVPTGVGISCSMRCF